MLAVNKKYWISTLVRLCMKVCLPDYVLSVEKGVDTRTRWRGTLQQWLALSQSTLTPSKSCTLPRSNTTVSTAPKNSKQNVDIRNSPDDWHPPEENQLTPNTMLPHPPTEQSSQPRHPPLSITPTTKCLKVPGSVQMFP